MENESEYLLLYGGAGSGKSEFIARKLFTRCRLEGGHQFLIMRKIRSRCKESVIRVLMNIMSEEKVKYHWHGTDRILSFPSIFGVSNEIIFDGLDDPLKIKSRKGVTGIWLEEMTEFTESDFAQIDLRLRGETVSYKQLIGSFNPDEAAGAWIKDKFFDGISDDFTGKGSFEKSFVHHSTIEDNPIASERDEYKRKLLRYKDPVLQSIYLKGQWAAAEGVIFPEWEINPLPSKERDWYDDVWLGGDFGYTINPTAVVQIYRKARELWFEEIIYQAGLTNQQIARLLEADPRIDVRQPSYWDSAEPKSIDELHAEGINAKPSLKGKDSVSAGIQFLKGYDCTVVDTSKNIIDEKKTYRWDKDKFDKLLNQPIKTNNHTMDAIRYGAYTHLFGAKEPYFGFSEGPVY